MSAVSLLWAAFAGCAVLDWWCCVRPHPRLEAVVKPGAMIALMGIALLSGARAHPTGVWLLVALVFCVLGDVLLLGDSDARFHGGLLAFLLGHLASPSGPDSSSSVTSCSGWAGSSDSGRGRGSRSW